MYRLTIISIGFKLGLSWKCLVVVVGNNEAGTSSSRQAAGAESRGNNYIDVRTLTINETALHNTPTRGATASKITTTDDGRWLRFYP